MIINFFSFISFSYEKQDKITEILKIRSACRNHCQSSDRRNDVANNNLKRLRTNNDLKSRFDHRSQHQHQTNLFVQEKRRRLPCLLQRLIDDGNLIKEAVRRLKSQRFSRSIHQKTNEFLDSPTTPNAKIKSSAISIPTAQSLNSVESSPTLPLSWFLSPNVVFTTKNQNSEHGSPIRTWMEIEVHNR